MHGPFSRRCAAEFGTDRSRHCGLADPSVLPVRVEVNLDANFDADHFRAPFLAVANDVRASEKSKVAQLTDRKFLHATAFISG